MELNPSKETRPEFEVHYLNDFDGYSAAKFPTLSQNGSVYYRFTNEVSKKIRKYLNITDDMTLDQCRMVAKKFRESGSDLFFLFQFREYKAIKQDLNGTKLYDLNNKPILCPGRSHSYYLAFEVYENAHIALYACDSPIFRPLILKFWDDLIEGNKSSERLESINERLKLIKERVLKDKKK